MRIDIIRVIILCMFCIIQMLKNSCSNCEKIKEDCDNMSRHRIEVLVEEIVKKIEINST